MDVDFGGKMLKLVFNPISSKFDYVDVPTSTPQSPVPLTIFAGDTYEVPDNVQIAYASDVVIEAGGSLLLTGNSQITWVD